MFFEVLFAVSILMILIISFHKTKDILHPATLLSLVFAVDIVFYVFMKIITKSKYTISPNVFYFSIGLIIFIIGTAIGSHNKIFNIEPLKDDRIKQVTIIYRVFIFIEIFVLILFIVDIVRYADVAYPSFINYITATRRYQYDEKYIFQIFRTISFVLSYFAIFQIFSKSIKREDTKFLLIQIAVTLVYMMFNTTRTVWFTFLIPSFMLVLFTKYRNGKALLKYGMIVFVILFIITLTITILREQATSLEMIRTYLCSGIVQFTEWMKNPEERLNGRYTFRILFAILSKLGIYHGDVLWVDQKYLDIPNADWFIGNVYTFYHGYAQDFGLMYALLIQFIVGIFHGYIYYKARLTKCTFWIMIYAIFMYPLIMQFFSDQYASSVSLWGQMVIITYIVTKTKVFYIFGDKNA